ESWRPVTSAVTPAPRKQALVAGRITGCQNRISEFTTSVLYDRAGTGWSDPAALPRTAAEVATELRDLLHAAGVPGPYLLAAHSVGGAYARRFARTGRSKAPGTAP